MAGEVTANFEVLFIIFYPTEFDIRVADNLFLSSKAH